ncbi:hypothetical protein BaRGS_00019498, partial [Batillaria attramentaria]
VLLVTLLACSLGTLVDGGRRQNRGRKQHTEATGLLEKNQRTRSAGRKGPTEALVWPKRQLKKLKEKITALKNECQSQNWSIPDKDPLDKSCSGLLTAPKPCSSLKCQGYTIAHLRAFRKPLKDIRKKLRGSVSKTIKQTDRAIRKLLAKTTEACLKEAEKQSQNDRVCNKKTKATERKACSSQLTVQLKNGARLDRGQLLASLTEKLESWFVSPRNDNGKRDDSSGKRDDSSGKRDGSGGKRDGTSGKRNGSNGKRDKWQAFADLPERQLQKLRNNRIKQMKTFVSDMKTKFESKEQAGKCGRLFDTSFVCRCASYFECTRAFVEGMAAFTEPLIVLNTSDIFDRAEIADRPSAASFWVEDMLLNISGRCKKAARNKSMCEVQPTQENAGRKCSQFLGEKLETENSDTKREIVYRFLDDFEGFVEKFDATSMKSKKRSKKGKNMVKNLKRE